MRHSLRFQIILWGLLPVLILVISFSLTGVQSHRRSMRALVAQRNTLLGQTLAHEIAHQVTMYRTSVQALAELWPLETAGVSPQTFLSPGLMLVYLTPEGSIQLLGHVSPSEEVAARWVRAVADSEQATVFDPQPALVWQQPLSDGGALVAGMPISTLQLDEWLDPVDISPYAALAIVSEGRLIYTSGNVTDEIRPLLTGRGTDSAYTVSLAPIAGTPWEVVIVEPWEPLTAPFFRLDRWLPFVVAGAIFFSGLALLYGIHTLVRPLHTLAQQARGVGRGEFDVVNTPVRGVREVEEVWLALRQMAEQVRDYQDALKQYIGRLTHMQEEERGRLARELHDGLVQDLVALDHRVQRLQRTLAADEALKEQLEDVRREIGTLITELRRTCQALRPLYLEELGLVSALEVIARDAGALFTVEGTPRRLDADTELALYRMVQEALNNVKRHAQASRVEVVVSFTPSALHIRVRDDGVGFHVPSRLSDFTAAGHFGLLSMTERAHLIGAHLLIRSAPQAGTTVEITLPLPTPGSGNPQPVRRTAAPRHLAGGKTGQ